MEFCLSWCRRHKPGRSSGSNFPADPDDDSASPGHEVLLAVPHGDPPASAQHGPLPQLQHGENKQRDACLLQSPDALSFSHLTRTLPSLKQIK